LSVLPGLETAGFFRGDGDGDGVERFLLPLLTKLAADPGHAARCARLIAAGRPKPQRATGRSRPGASREGSVS